MAAGSARMNRLVVRQAAANLERVGRLRKQQMISEDEHLRAVTTLEVARAEEASLRTRIGYARIAAPFDGIVAERLAEPGDVVARHSHVMTLVDPASLVIEPSVSEMLLPHVALGDTVTVSYCFADIDLERDKDKIVTIERYTEAYFKLTEENTRSENLLLAQQQAGEELIVRLRGQTYRIR